MDNALHSEAKAAYLRINFNKTKVPAKSYDDLFLSDKTPEIGRNFTNLGS